VKRRNPSPKPAAYEVGYAKPPKAHQWKPGESGNPLGRPKGSRNKPTLEAFLREAADKFYQAETKKLLADCGLSEYGIKPRPRRAPRV